VSGSSRVPAAFPSDAPLASEITTGPGGVSRLRRTLDAPWREDRRARQALAAEIEANSRIPLDSGALVPLLGAGDAPEPWLMREFFEGGTLAHRLRAAAWPRGSELLTVVGWMLSALDEVESLGLTHGDPSPANLFLTTDGAVRLGDLRSARAAFAAAPVTRKPGSEVRTDRGRFLRWLVPLVGRCDPQDPLVAAFTGALAGGATEEVQIPRLRRLVEEREADAGPVLSAPARPAVRPAASPAPVLVAVVAGPVPDEKASYLAAKHLAALSNRPLPDLRAALRAGTATVDLLYPGPACDLVGQLVAMNVPARIRPAGASG
jgi:hypothetical protein